MPNIKNNSGNPELKPVKAGEYDNLLDRFQTIWAKLNFKPKSEAPDIFIEESERASAGARTNPFNSEEAIFIVSDRFLEIVSDPGEQDAVIYHEVGHQIKGHSLFTLGVDNHGQEFAADSIAAINGHADKLESALCKIEQDEVQNNETILPKIVSDLLDKIYSPSKDDIHYRDSESHPNTYGRIQQMHRIEAQEYDCENPDAANKKPDFNKPTQQNLLGAIFSKLSAPTTAENNISFAEEPLGPFDNSEVFKSMRDSCGVLQAEEVKPDGLNISATAVPLNMQAQNRQCNK